MKKLFIILVIQTILLSVGYTQVIPKGMNYQAVARDHRGEIISTAPISIKIHLLGNEDGVRREHYTELHEVTTNGLGLFNLIVGEGKKEQGEYGLIPWNKENIWMEVAIQDKGKVGFTTVSSSKLMAVPYAIHAGTADRLVDKNTVPVSTFAPPEPGVVSTEWSVFGNAQTDASGNIFRLNSLGTTDVVDLIMITNNIERLRILSTGDIVTKLNFEVGEDLTVIGNATIHQSLTVGDSLQIKKNVLLNILGGSTINYGPFTVANQSPTLLTGILTVDQAATFNTSLTVEGATDLNNRLHVNKMGPTRLSGTLQVDKSTDLNDALNVNNMSPVYLSGTLQVDKATDLNDSLTVNNMSATHLTGTLEVDKSTNLNDSLTINNMSPTVLTGTLRVDKEALFKKPVLISDLTQSISTASGALVVNGGLGLQGNLNVGGSSAFGGPVGFSSPVSVTDTTQSTSPLTGALKVTGGAGIGKNLNVGGMASVAGMTSITDTTQSTNTTTGALKVSGGAGIGKNLNVGGTTTIAGLTNITNIAPSTNATTGALKVTGGLGIGLQLNVGGKTSILDVTQSTSATTGALKVSGGMGIGLQLNVGGMTSILDITQSTSATTGAMKVSGGAGIGLQLNVGGMASILDATQSTSNTTGALTVAGGVGIRRNLNVGGTLTVGGLATLNSKLALNGSLSVTSSNSFIASFINTSDRNGISIQVASSDPTTSNNFVEFKNNAGIVVGRIEGQNATQQPNNPNYIRELALYHTLVTLAEYSVAEAAVNVVLAAAELVAALTSATACLGFGACATFPIPSLVVGATLKIAIRGGVVAATTIGLNTAKERRDAYINFHAARVGVTYESGSGDYAEWLPKADPSESFLPGEIVGVSNGYISRRISENSKILVISTQPIVLGNMPEKANQSNFEKVAFLGQVPVQVKGQVKIGDYIVPSGAGDGMGRAIHPSEMQAENYEQVVGIAWSASTENTYSLINVAIGLYSGDISKVIIEQNILIKKLESEFNETNLVLARMVPGFKEEVGVSEAELNHQPSVSSENKINKVARSQETSPVNNFASLGITDNQILETMDLVEKTFRENGSNTAASEFWKQLKKDPGYFKRFINETAKFSTKPGQ